MARAQTTPVSFRTRLADFLESSPAQTGIIALILVNAVIFGLETIPPVMAAIGPVLYALDHAILMVFVVEIAARLFAFGSRFFRDPWSVFDLAVIGIALLPATGSLSALRALRVMRVLRLVSAMPALRSVVDALLRAMPAMGSVAALLALVLYVGAVIATKLFGATHPEWFGDLGRSLLTLFQILTLEGWADIMRDVAEQHRFAWLFFVPFVLIATFAVLNLVVAVIVDSMQSGVRAAVAEEEEERDAELRRELDHDLGDVLREIRKDLAELKASVSSGQSKG
ncbi:ion transporter [Flaviflagellibacter deserti]|uniref:Ion transporter n=1 Tax=Flaviflagellibacter deserti TaxID=2267266 RepID=A0ABV9Z0M3_9HYPH